VWDINADEWSGYQYYGSYPEVGTVYRASDHDPIVLGVSASPPTVTIDLLGINDFHGRLEAAAPAAGAAVLAGAVNALRAENPNTLFVSAGDNIGASTFTSFVQDDVPTIDALNAAGLDVSAFGNHEFDQGRADVDDRVLDLADFPYLAANLYDRATGEPAYQDYYVADEGGVTVGFVGAVTELLPELVSPAGISTLEVRDVVTEVNRVAADLSDGVVENGEADVLVVLLHDGPNTAAIEDITGETAFGQVIADLSDEVDAVFTGHTHQMFAHLIPDGDLPLPVVSSGQYGENLAHVQLVVDPSTGDVVANSAAVVPLFNAFPPDAAVAAIVADAASVASGLGAVRLGDITDNLNRARQADGTTENRGGESTLGNLVADVQLWATQDAGTQIAFMNPGGLRTNLTYASTGAADPDGNVTFKEAANVQPFANTLVALTLTGAQVAQVLEEQWQPSGASRPFLKLGVAGLTYTYDPTAAAGDRITQVWVGDSPLDPAGTYRVAANSFLASGGDNFTTLGQGTNNADTGKVDLQAFVDYFAEFSPITPDLTQRAVGVHVATAAPVAGFLPGDSVTVDLSSLLFSAGEPQGDTPTAVLTIGRTQVTSSAIVPTPVNTTDEVGQATATFIVPADAPAGDLEVVVTVPSTLTTASFTILVDTLLEFSDVPASNPFHDEILWLARAGITRGYSDGTFRGTAPVSREAMAAFLYRLTHAGADAPPCDAQPFPDVTTTNPFCGEITWLADQGITTGYSDGTFRPSAPVARDAMAAFIYRLVEGGGAAPACTVAPFTDVPTGRPFCGEIQWIKDNGLSTGWPDGTYRPSVTVERQAMAAFLFRLADGGLLDR